MRHALWRQRLENMPIINSIHRKTQGETFRDGLNVRHHVRQRGTLFSRYQLLEGNR